MRGKSLIKLRPRPLQVSSSTIHSSRNRISPENKSANSMNSRRRMTNGRQERRPIRTSSQKYHPRSVCRQYSHCTALIMSNNETSRSLNQAGEGRRLRVVESRARFSIRPRNNESRNQRPWKCLRCNYWRHRSQLARNAYAPNTTYVWKTAPIYTQRPLSLVLGINWTAKGQRRIRFGCFQPFPASNGFDCNDAGDCNNDCRPRDCAFPCSWIFNGTFGIARLLIFMVPLFLWGSGLSVRDKKRKLYFHYIWFFKSFLKAAEICRISIDNNVR